MEDKELLSKALNEIYPLTVVMDRYTGTYSGGKFTAWNLEFWDVDEEISGDDCTCAGFFGGIDETSYGIGNTPDEAIVDLYKKLRLNKE